MKITKCRACGSEDLQLVINLGDQYLSDFRKDDLKPKKYPLELLKCAKCHFCQLAETAPFAEMYTENYGFKSGVNDTIKADLKDIADQAKSYINRETVTVLDIGSNDGQGLSNYAPKDFKVGIDPIKKLCVEATPKADFIINDFFSKEKVEFILGKDFKFDIITAISMFYDVEDPDKLIADMVSLLKEDGVITIQQNYILATLKNNAYDNICHEHIGYHSLLSMEYLFEKNGLEVVDVSTSMVNGGVLRTVVQRKGVSEPTSRVQEQRDLESAYCLDNIITYRNFAYRVESTAKKLKELIVSINKEGKKCYIYGASTRGGTIWQYVGLDVKDLPFAVDRNPEKVGKKIASIGVPIISEEQARLDKPEYMLVSIWFFKDEVLEREKEYLEAGGKLIMPLPGIEIYDSSYNSDLS